MPNRTLRNAFDIVPGSRKTIDTLTASIRKQGVVKTNQFEVRFNFPRGVNGIKKYMPAATTRNEKKPEA